MSQRFYSRVAASITNRFSPLQIVMTVSMLVLVGCILIRYYAQGNIDPHLKFQTYDSAESLEEKPSRQYTASTLGDEDPAVRYADRLRDASALSISFSLYVLNERLVNKRLLMNIPVVLDGLNKSGLLPPGVTVVSGVGLVRSASGLYYIRYRPNPFGLEVLAVGGNGLADGDVFLIRLPESTTAPSSELAPSQLAGGYATIFTAPHTDTIVPTPFSPASDFAGARWKQEPLRATPYSQQQVEALKVWLAQYKQSASH